MLSLLEELRRGHSRWFAHPPPQPRACCDDCGFAPRRRRRQFPLTWSVHGRVGSTVAISSPDVPHYCPVPSRTPRRNGQSRGAHADPRMKEVASRRGGGAGHPEGPTVAAFPALPDAGPCQNTLSKPFGRTLRSASPCPAPITAGSPPIAPPPASSEAYPNRPAIVVACRPRRRLIGSRRDPDPAPKPERRHGAATRPPHQSPTVRRPERAGAVQKGRVDRCWTVAVAEPWVGCPRGSRRP